jgi:hypothetical protein
MGRITYMPMDEYEKFKMVASEIEVQYFYGSTDGKAAKYFCSDSAALATGMGMDMTKMVREREEIDLPVGEEWGGRYHLGGNLWGTEEQHNEYMKEIKRELDTWLV